MHVTELVEALQRIRDDADRAMRWAETRDAEDAAFWRREAAVSALYPIVTCRVSGIVAQRAADAGPDALMAMMDRVVSGMAAERLIERFAGSPSSATTRSQCDAVAKSQASCATPR